MPYITQEARIRLAERDMPGTAGELNYLITTLILDYMQRKSKSYAAINEVIGALECSKLEFYRRYVSGYEDEKARANGDVFREM